MSRSPFYRKSSKIKVVNQVLSCEVNKVLTPSDYGEYNPKRFSGVIIRDGKARLLVYRSNKINVTGVTSYKEAKEVILRNLPEVKITCLKTVNITAITLIKNPINLQEVRNNDHFSWEPELFPGALFRKGQQTIIFFTSGKVIMTGFKTKTSLKPVFQQFIQQLNDI